MLADTPENKAATQLARRELASRKAASLLFSSLVARSSAWDMLLELYLSAMAGQRTQTTHLIEEAGVPRATGLRLIEKLRGDGLIERFQMAGDNRSKFVRLTVVGINRMEAYFRAGAVGTKAVELDLKANLGDLSNALGLQR